MPTRYREGLARPLGHAFELAVSRFTKTSMDSPVSGSRKLVAILPAIYGFGLGANCLDMDVMVAALRSNTGASGQLLIFALTKRFELLLSVPLMLEYEAVLKRPEHRRTASATRDDIDAILDALGAAGVAVIPNFSWRPELTDP